MKEQNPPTAALPQAKKPEPAASKPEAPLTEEFGGVTGPEPTRYGDWQHKGRVSDF